MSYSRVVADLSDFLNAYHDLAPFLRGAVRPGTSLARNALALKMERLREGVTLLMMTEFEDTPATITALVWLHVITLYFDAQYDLGKAIELSQEDKQRFGKALELLKAADSPEAPPASPSDPAVRRIDPSTDPSTTPGTPPEPPPGTESEAKGTTNTGERRRGQALSKQEEKEYRRIINTAKRLNLPNRTVGNTAKIADAAKVDTGIVTKALKWGRRHGRY